jgi:DnaJ domain
MFDAQQNHLADEDDDPEHSRLYAILNLPRNYNATILHSQSRSLLRAFHPDKAATDDVQPTFLQIKLAVDTLSDPIMKEAYDYGGMMAVQIIKNHANLYQLLADRTAPDDRVAILSRVLTESQHSRQRSTMPQWMSNSIQVSANAPCYWDPAEQQLEKNSLFVTWKQNINNHIKASLVSNGLINLDFSSLFSVTFGKRLLFHASRVFSDSQSVVKFTAGRGTASVRSIRTLQGGAFLAVWGVDVGAGGTIRSLMMSLQTNVWKVRLAVADYFVKVTTTQFGFHGSLAFGLYGARYKLVRSYHVQEHVELKYGVKLSPGSPLLPVFYLSTPQLSLRLPMHGVVNLANGWLLTSFLAVEGMELLFGDDAFMRKKLSEIESKIKQRHHNNRWNFVVRSVADRKRRSSRLKILHAKFGSTDDQKEECGHWIQFWIDEWAGALVFRPDDPRWEWLPAGPGTIRYIFDGQVFETSITTRPGTLRLPAPDALCLGDSAIVH